MNLDIKRNLFLLAFQGKNIVDCLEGKEREEILTLTDALLELIDRLGYSDSFERFERINKEGK